MGTSKLVRALQRVERHIQRIATDAAKRVALTRELAGVVALRRAPSPGLAHSGGEILRDHVLQRVGYLSAALHAVHEHGLPPVVAARIAGICGSDLAYAQDLIQRAGRDATYVSDNIDEAVRSAVDAALQRLVVELTPSALASMVSAALEGYVARPGSRSEMYGTAYGSVSIGEPEKTHERLHHVRVDRFAPQTKAKATHDAVWPSARAHAVHELVTNELLRDGSYIVGEAHSHVFDTWTDAVTHRGWTCSEHDADHTRVWQVERIAAGQRGYVSLVVAVAKTGQERKSWRRATRNRLRLLIGGFDITIAAYRVQLDGSMDTQLRLEIAEPFTRRAANAAANSASRGFS